MSSFQFLENTPPLKISPSFSMVLEERGGIFKELERRGLTGKETDTPRRDFVRTLILWYP
jgi:hypothetical protein